MRSDAMSWFSITPSLAPSSTSGMPLGNPLRFCYGDPTEINVIPIILVCVGENVKEMIQPELPFRYGEVVTGRDTECLPCALWGVGQFIEVFKDLI